MSLFSRLLTLMLILGMAPLVPAGALLFYYQKQVKSQTLTYHQNLSSASAASIRQYLSTLTGRLAFTQKLENLITANASGKEVNDYLDTVLSANPDFMLIGVVDSRGRGVTVKGLPQMLSIYGKLNVSGEPVFLDSRKSGELVISKFSQQFGQPVASLALPLTDGKYLFMVAGFGALWDSLERLAFGETGHIYLSDENGYVFRFFTDMPVVSGEELQKMYAQADTAKIENIDSSYGKLVGAYAKVPDINLVVLILQEKKEAFWLVKLITSMIAFFSLFILTCAYFAALYIARRIDMQVTILGEGALKLQKGDFEYRIDPFGAWPEFLHLMNTFNAVSAELKRYSALQVDKIVDEKKKTDLLLSLMRDGVILASKENIPLFMNTAAKQLLENDFFYAVTAGAQGTEKEQNAVEYLLSLKDEDLSLEFPQAGSETVNYYKIVTEVFGAGSGGEVNLIVMRDVTADKEVEIMKSDFLNGVAHDLKAPLLGIQGYVRLIASDKVTAQQKAVYIAAMQNVANKILVMVEDLLDAARLESGNRSLVKTDFKISEVIKRAIEFMQPFAETKKLNIRVETDDNAVVYADERLIERVITNLLSNAAKFTAEGGNVIVRYRVKNAGHVISVSDNGAGISPVNIKTIFNKFSQFGLQRQNHSYGLGLSVVKQIVELHGGKISVRSTINKGSTFNVVIPCSQKTDA